jgi:predicted TPR repeat methyltransferase
VAGETRPCLVSSGANSFVRELVPARRYLILGVVTVNSPKSMPKAMKYWGLDIDTEALNKAKQKLSMQVQKADLHADWGVERGVYDVVVAGEVLEHLYYPEVVIGKVKNALKQDGLFIGSVPNAFSLIKSSTIVLWY